MRSTVKPVQVRRHDNPYALAHKFVSRHRLDIAHVCFLWLFVAVWLYRNLCICLLLPMQVVKLAKIIEARLDVFLRAEAAADDEARRAKTRQDIRSFWHKSTKAEPFELAVDSRASSTNAASQEQQQQPRSSNGALVGRLHVEVSAGRTGAIAIRAHDNPHALVSGTE